MVVTGCYECSQKNGHAATGGKHLPFHCKRDLCPDKAKHYEQVYAGRITHKYGHATRDGVLTYVYIDGNDHYWQERCICGLVLLYTPKVMRTNEEVPDG